MSPVAPKASARSGDHEDRDRDQPFALVESGARGIRLAAVNAAARQAGLAAGECLADARAVYPGLKTSVAAPSVDRVRLQRLARWLGRYGIGRNAYGFTRPAAGGYAVRHYGLWVDISGVAHLYGGEAALLADLDSHLLDFGLTAHVGLADTLGAAHAIAWYGGPWRIDHRIAAPGRTLEAISSLPVEGLRIDTDCTKLLRRFGLKTIADLAAIPRSSIERRFQSRREGQRVLLRLDQALGTITEPRRPLVEMSALAADAVFPEPLVSSEALLSATECLVQRLCLDAKSRHRGIRAARLTLSRSDGSCTRIVIGTSQPSVDARHIMRLLGEKLPSIDLGFGADVLVLEATRTDPLIEDQTTLAASAAVGQGAGPDDVATDARLIDRLANRLGSTSVTRLAAVASHWPERASISVPALECSFGSSVNAKSGEANRETAWHIPGRALRPLVLFDRPEPIDLHSPTPGAPHTALQFTWRKRTHAIAQAIGPERIEIEWWRAIGADPQSLRAFRPRDYYRVLDRTGAIFWIYRADPRDEATRSEDADNMIADHEDASSAWFLHGILS